MVLCMEDYMKPSLRNTPDNFILYVGTNDLSSENLFYGSRQINNKSGM